LFDHGRTVLNALHHREKGGKKTDSYFLAAQARERKEGVPKKRTVRSMPEGGRKRGKDFPSSIVEKRGDDLPRFILREKGGGKGRIAHFFFSFTERKKISDKKKGNCLALT